MSSTSSTYEELEGAYERLAERFQALKQAHEQLRCRLSELSELEGELEGMRRELSRRDDCASELAQANDECALLAFAYAEVWQYALQKLQRQSPQTEPYWRAVFHGDRAPRIHELTKLARDVLREGRVFP